MKFLYPGFLYALVAIAIPIIIHLFNFRRYKKVYFSNVKFLQEVKQQTKAKNNLKHLLILLARILAITFLVLAFAQPYFPVDDQLMSEKNKSVSIYIDNSFSMDAVGKNGRLLDHAKQLARDIINIYEPTDQFHLVTNNFLGKHHRFVDKKQIIEWIDEIETTPKVKTIDQVNIRQIDLLKEQASSGKIAYVISDFQKNISELDRLQIDSAISVKFIPINGIETNNLYIDSCWFTSPFRQVNKQEKLIVRIKNKTDQAHENVPVKLTINGQQRALGSFNVEADEQVEVELNFISPEAGIKKAEVSITDYPIIFDDTYYFSYEVAERLSVLLINGDKDNNQIQRLFKRDSLIQLTKYEVGNIDYSSFNSQNTIILKNVTTISSGLNRQLLQFVEEGGSLLVFPAKSAQISTYNEFLLSFEGNSFSGVDSAKKRIEDVSFDHPLYDGVFEEIPENIDLPTVNFNYVTKQQIKNNEQQLLRLSNNRSYLSLYNYKLGKVYVCSSPLGENNGSFVQHAIFVPTLYQIVLQSISTGILSYSISDNSFVTLNKNFVISDNILHVVSTQNNFDVIPEYRVIDNKPSIMLHDQISVAGNYDIKKENELIGAVAYNYSRLESDLSFYSWDELLDEIEHNNLFTVSLLNGTSSTLVKQITELKEGKQFWKYCVLLVLLFLGLETILLRLKNNS